MKNDKLEQFFSDKLENFEAPYDASAWKNLSSQLDAKTGVSAGNSSFLKWAAALVGTAALIGGAYWISLEKETLPIAESITPNEKEVTELPKNEVKQLSPIDKHSPIERIGTPEFTEESPSIEAPTVTPKEGATSSATVENTASSTSSNIGLPERESTTLPLASTRNFVSGVVASTLVCPGEQITISNPNQVFYVRVLVGDFIGNIAPGSNIQLPAQEGITIINYLDSKNEVFSSTQVEVASVKTPMIDFSANIYEEGLPIANFRVYGDFREIEWNFDNGMNAKGQEVSTYYFERGQYTVQVAAIDHNGCSSKAESKVEILEKYNLLATNSIRLNDINMETRTFMPFCLKERNVPFTLTIIDPKDNGIVYITKDINKPWDGSDPRHGRPATVNKTYIWQVQLDETVEGERGIYNGTITLVE